jgi:RNA 2',3'-cyclic 3'-phosphodiesterase
MRVFFGIELDRATALRIADWRDRQFGASGRPVPVANFHITLAFAGELPLPAIDTLCQGVEQWLAEKPGRGGVLQLDQTGFWPNPGLYWLGPSRWPESLEAQARRLRNLVAAAGARRDRRRFQPHITLFRRCAQAPPMPARAPDFRLDYRGIALFESRQQREGVSYHVLQDWPLRGGTEGPS